MLITKDFTKALNGLFITALVLYGLSVLMSALGVLGYSVSESDSSLRIILNQVFSLIPVGAFWFAVGYLTKEKRGAWIAFLINLALHGYTVFQLLSLGASMQLFQSLYWQQIIVSIVAYLVFGLIHFRSSRGLYLLIVFIVMNGIGVGSDARAYYSVINNLFHFVGFKDLLALEISTGESSYRTVNLFVPFITEMYWPLKLIVFWFIFSKIKKATPVDITLRTTELFSELSKVTFSIIYWMLRLTLFVVVIGLMAYLERVFRDGSGIEEVLRLMFCCFAVYVVGSLYRNFLCSWFISKGWYPGWLYLALNIPVIHFFAWIIALSKKSKQEETHQEGEVSATNREKIVSPAERLQERFIKDDRNKGVKAVIVLLLLVSLIFKLGGVDYGLNQSMDGHPAVSLVLAIVIAIITVGLTVWYFNDKRAAFILFTIQSIIIVLVGATQVESLLQVTTAAGLVNIIVYYPLFHFDQLKFRKVQ